MTTIKPELPDQLLSKVKTPEDLLGEGGVVSQSKMALIETALGTGRTHNFGCENAALAPAHARRNSRNGHSSKTVRPMPARSTFRPRVIGPRRQGRYGYRRA